MSEVPANLAEGSQSTSSNLLRRVCSRDAEAWRVLVQLYGPLVVRWCLRDGLSEADAADVAQDVFRSVAESVSRFRRDRPGDTFRGWLRTITANAKRDFWRRERKQPHGLGGSTHQQMLGNVPQEDSPSQLSAQELREESQLVQLRALNLIRAEFEAKTWNAFWQTAVEGLNATQAAAELGLSPAAVRKAKSRVMRRLREMLADPDEL